jgi:flavin-dependent dehydrogenase
VNDKRIDVAVLGGGLAGNLFARQLKMTKPELEIVIFERDVERGYKVGESTVEIAANYLVRKQKLSRYLYMKQLPKNSLRFFFDNEQKNADLTELSEIGVYHLPPIPSFQLDRARFETDLIEMNRELGTEVQIPAVVKEIRLSNDGGEHQVDVDREGERTTYRCKWVIDAAGRSNLLAKQLDLRVAAPEHRIVSSWTRAANVTDMDAWKDEAWLERVRRTARTLSTNHFCYDGYWLWFIPLSNDLISLGIVQRREQWKPEQGTKAGFMKFMREHKCCEQMLEKAELVDFGMFNQLAYRTKKFWDGPQRWATIGDAGAFHDPFYSPGSDFISLEADCLTDMITRDYAGEDIAERSQLMNDFIQFRFDTTILLYSGLYPTFGSYELYREKCFFDCANYYNLWVEAFVKDEHLDPKALRYHLRRKSYVIEMMRNFNRFFAGAADEMKQKKTYWRGNLGNWVMNGIQAFGVPERLGVDRSHKEMNDRTSFIFNGARQEVLKLLADESTVPYQRGLAPPRKTVLEDEIPLERLVGDVDVRTLMPMAHESAITNEGASTDAAMTAAK